MFYLNFKVGTLISLFHLRPLDAFTSLTHPHPPPQAGALVATIGGSVLQTQRFLRILLYLNFKVSALN